MKVNYKRQVLYEGGRCHYCRLEFHKVPKSDFDPEKAATIEHLIPRSQEHLIPKEYRGKFNTVLACTRCNGLRGNMDYELFEYFGRTVIRPNRDVPTPILRRALRQFVDSLAMIAVRNTREANRAAGNAVLSMAEEIKSWQERRGD